MRYGRRVESVGIQRKDKRMAKTTVNEKRALGHLMDLLKIEGLSGRESKVAKLVKKKLLHAGCKSSWIRDDKANRHIPGGFEIGNLIVRIPGSLRGPRRLFLGHMDTVPLARGAVPVRKGNRISSQGDTALGGDDRTAVAALITLVETLLRNDVPHPPLTVLFTVGEEVGLWGARTVSKKDLGNPSMGFNVDGGRPRDIVIGAIGADRWHVHVHGQSSHAGVHPEAGISASLVAARAIAEVARRGYFGKVKKGRKEGTSNVGVIQGGEATNQVTDYVFVRGESRSHEADFVAEITQAYRTAFDNAAESVKNDRGRHGSVDFHAETDYRSFRMDEDSPPVELALRCSRKIRLRPATAIANGGLDANYLNEKGIPTVTLGTGQHRIHTVDEYVDVKEFLTGCRLLLAVAAA